MNNLTILKLNAAFKKIHHFICKAKFLFFLLFNTCTKLSTLLIFLLVLYKFVTRALFLSLFLLLELQKTYSGKSLVVFVFLFFFSQL